MIVREWVPIGALGQDATTTAAVLTPIVGLGPVRIAGATGQPIPGLMATVRTPSQILKVVEVPGGLFTHNVDKVHFDQGVSVIFGASGYPSYTIPAQEIACNSGTRDEGGNVVQITNNPCVFPVQFLLRPGETAPNLAPPPPTNYGTQPYYPPQPPPPAYAPYPPQYAPAYQPPPQVYQAPEPAPAPVRRRRTTTAKSFTQDQAAPAPAPSPVTPKLLGMNPYVLAAAGGGVLLLGVLGLAVLKK